MTSRSMSDGPVQDMAASSVDSSRADAAKASPGGELLAEDLGKRVRLPDHELTILEGVGFRIGAGEAVAIVGASGSGKSTLLSLLAGLDLPSTGRVLLDGVELSTLDEDGRARIRGEKVGFVFQSFQLLPALTALENVMLPLELRGDRDAAGPARRILERVGLVTGPALLFADEPTGNLDTDTGRAVIDLLFELNAQAGTTLVLVTHDERLAARCGRILRLDRGKLVGAA
jgi:putative ABC transport system ATP-binding protein